MAEYYAVLSKAVVGLTESAEARRKVYDKARNALIGQLKAIDPPLPTAEISRQRLELEEAIRRVEREAAAAAVSASPKAPRPQDPPARRPLSDSPQDVPADQASPDESASGVFRRAVEEAGSQQRNMTAEAEPAPPAQSYRQVAETERYLEHEPQGTAPAPQAPVDHSDPGASAPHEHDRPAGRDPAAPSRGYDYEWDRDAEPPPPIPDPFSDQRDPPNSSRRRRRPRDADLGQRPPRRSRVPAILLTVLVLVMLVGLAAFGWSQREIINDLLAAFDQGSETAAPVQSSSPPPSSSSSEPAKVNDRLPGGDTASGARVVEAQPSTDQLARAPSGGENNAPPVQSATLYEEPVDPSAAEAGVVAIDADVRWTFSASGASGPEIVAELVVPDRNLNIRVAISRNTDQTLPASHLVVVTSQGAVVGIDKIPRLVFKSSESGRGAPLIGATAKVADGLFWIALSANADDVAFNIDLIRERSWIDLPLVYDSGQRAILTFEKGAAGASVVEQALAAWEAG